MAPKNSHSDLFDREIKVGDVIAYACTQGRSADLKIAIVVDTPIGKGGVRKLKIRPLYTPSAYRVQLHDDKAKLRSIAASDRVLRLDVDEAGVRALAAERDARYRLGSRA